MSRPLGRQSTLAGAVGFTEHSGASIVSGIPVTLARNLLAEKPVGIFLVKRNDIGKGGSLQMAPC